MRLFSGAPVERGEVVRAKGSLLRGADPEIPVYKIGSGSGCHGVTFFIVVAITPGMHILQLTNGAFSDELTNVGEIGIEMALSTALGRDLVPILQIGLTDHSCFFHGIRQWLLAIHV